MGKGIFNRFKNYMYSIQNVVKKFFPLKSDSESLGTLWELFVTTLIQRHTAPTGPHKNAETFAFYFLGARPDMYSSFGKALASTMSNTEGRQKISKLLGKKLTNDDVEALKNIGTNPMRYYNEDKTLHAARLFNKLQAMEEKNKKKLENVGTKGLNMGKKAGTKLFNMGKKAGTKLFNAGRGLYKFI